MPVISKAYEMLIEKNAQGVSVIDAHGSDFDITFKYLATDRNGKIFAFTHEVVLDELSGRWQPRVGLATMVGKVDPESDFDWTQTLVRLSTPEIKE